MSVTVGPKKGAWRVSMIRRATTGAMAVAVAALLSACVAADVEDPGQRAAAGAVLGATAGAALGATLAIDPPLGALIGAESGAALGAVTGAITAPPEPSYRPIPVPAEAVIPRFYDNWPPGYYAPPGNPETQSPNAG